MNQSDKIPWTAVLITAVGPLIWGTTYFVTTEFLPPDRPFWAAMFRCLPAGLVLIAMTRFAIPTRLQWPKLLILSALNIAVFQALLFVAAYRLPGGLAAVMGAVQPLMVMALVLVIDRIRPSMVASMAAVLGVLGMAILLVGPSARWDGIGVAAALGGAACMGIGTYLTKRWQLGLPVLALTGWQLFLGGLMLLPLTLLWDPPLPSLNFTNVLGYAYLCIFGSVIAYTLWFRGFAPDPRSKDHRPRLPAAAVSSLALLSPLSAVIVGWLMLDQSLTPKMILGFLLVLASVIGVQIGSRTLRQ